MTPIGEKDGSGVAAPCVILGSGFSRAISSAMPTLTDLGVRVLDRLSLAPSVLSPFDGNLEQWMSYLAADQPWLGTSKNLENRAMFLRVADAVSLVVAESEIKAARLTPPDWLLKLVWHWSENAVQIITFNYDTLVERSVAALGYMPWAPMYAASLETRNAPYSSPFLSPSPPSHAYPTLFKLHGSVNWMFGGVDAPTDSRIVLTKGWGGWHESAETPPKSGSRLYADLVPLIVPPTFSKGPYYGNLSLRAQWRDAAAALDAASEVTVIGYSFPPGDLMVRHWLASTRTKAPVTVVDANPAVAGQVGQIVGAEPAAAFDGESAVAGYVTSLGIRLLRWRRRWVDGAMDIEITLDGEDQLTAAEHIEKPWNAEGVRSDVWLGERLNDQWPEAQATTAVDPLRRGSDPNVHEANMAFLRSRGLNPAL